MNPDLPFDDGTTELDEFLAEIDRALDALFMDEVHPALAAARTARPPELAAAAG
ncbi:MAG TPA: hypothetical protein VML50_10620 [Anaeromyxobacter sp.]|nr:hypothetical protein [Anaeromyxobacter sp.]